MRERREPRERAKVAPNDTEGLRERKKRATRQLISDTATRLFVDHGFDRVTIDDVAAAANVSKMTVFNYFPRKEDLFFDRTDDLKGLLREALASRGRRSPVAAIRQLAHDLVERGHPMAKVTREVAGSWKVVSESAALRARGLELLEELAGDLAGTLAATVQAPPHDPVARLISGIVVSTWRIAFEEALRCLRGRPATAVRDAFLELIDRGLAAASTASRGTPYA